MKERPDSRILMQGYRDQFAINLSQLLSAVEHAIPRPTGDEEALALISVLAEREIHMHGGDVWNGASTAWSLGVCDAAAIVVALSDTAATPRRDADWWRRRFVNDHRGAAHLEHQAAIVARLLKTGEFKYIEP